MERMPQINEPEAVDHGSAAADAAQNGNGHATVGPAPEWRAPWLAGQMPEGELRPRVLIRDAIFRRSLAVADIAACGVAVYLTIST
jgi:hypothetical protein